MSIQSAMITKPTGNLPFNRAAAEWRGQTRLLRAAVLESDKAYQRFLDAMALPIRLRLRSKQMLRPDHAQAIVDQWRKQSIEYRVSLSAHIEKKALHIEEVRIVASKFQDAAWTNADNVEPGLSVVRVALLIGDGRMALSVEPMAVVSAHGIARRMERGEDRSRFAVLRDIARLAAPGFQFVEADGWSGSTVVAGARVDDANHELRSARTWLS